MNAGRQFEVPAAALRFLLSGNAVVTAVSVRSKGRFTFKVQRAKESKGGRRPWFVKRLAGSEYRYLGFIPERAQDTPDRRVVAGKSIGKLDAQALAAFEWVLRTLLTSKMAATIIPTLEVWHEGTCGRCSRPLTDPASIAIGIGPVCREKLGL